MPSQQPAAGYELLLDRVKTSGEVALFNQGQVPEEDSAEHCWLATLPAAGGMRAPVLPLGEIWVGQYSIRSPSLSLLDPLASSQF